MTLAAAAFFQIGEGGVVGSRDPMADHELLGERLRTFQARRLLARAEAAQAGIPEAINDAGRQRCLRANHRQADVLCLRQFQEGVDVLGGYRRVAHPGFQRRAGIAWRDDHFLHIF